jgi:hypothetical protein
MKPSFYLLLGISIGYTVLTVIIKIFNLSTYANKLLLFSLIPSTLLLISLFYNLNKKTNN